MKLIVSLIISFISLTGFSQEKQIIGHITKGDSLVEYAYLTVFLKHADSIINGAVPDSIGNFSLKQVERGFYNLVIRRFGQKDFLADSLLILGDTSINIDITYPPPCKFVYKNGQQPTCIGGHTDKIIPIVYGLPTRKTMDKAKKGLVYLGGCMVTDCDPRYYCTIHKTAL